MSAPSKGSLSTQTGAGHPSEKLTQAKRTLISTLVVLAVVVSALALWQLRVVVALLFAALTIASAMRPPIEWLARHRIPRPVGLLLHYLGVLAVTALLLYLVVPQLIAEVQAALSSAHHPGLHTGGGLKNQILNALSKRLRRLPSVSQLIHPAISVGKAALEVLVGIFFTFACAAYWIFERDRAVDLFARMLPRPKRKKFRDTWDLIDAKLGAFVRGQLLLVGFVGLLVSGAYRVIGEPYWLILGILSGILEVIPVVGPLAAVIAAVGVGMTVSWHVALFAALAFLAIRLLEDYVVSPRVLGGSVGLSPLLVLIAVSGTGILLGAFYVLIAVPAAAVLATVIEVLLLGVEPAEVDPPTVLFPAKDAE